MTVSTLSVHHRSAPILNQVLLGMGGLLLLACLGWLQGELDRRQDRTVVQIEGLAQLPKGEYLKPALLGYHHLGADLLWLRLLQVVGQRRISADEFEWMYHALDVITTLDPQYAYAYYAGGSVLVDQANRPDLSNRLLPIRPRERNILWRLPADRMAHPISLASQLAWRRRRGALTRPWRFLKPAYWRRKIRRRENPWRTG
ncbi:MAG: hypothetical protein E6K65_09920 [Nitrospirae bacterium]|nr:MAG: hypothetical protein E6K65_09920 [Nitrospirota bacterium]